MRRWVIYIDRVGERVGREGGQVIHRSSGLVNWLVG